MKNSSNNSTQIIHELKEAQPVYCDEELLEKTALIKVKFEIYGEEMISKRVKQVGAQGRAGRIYLPPEWIGKRIKMIRMD